MHASAILASAAALAGTAAAIPALADLDELRPIEALAARDGQAVDATMPWIGVDDNGQPTETHTPSVTTDDTGATSVVDGAPHDLTASVFTFTNYAIPTTSTGEPPNPSATAKGGEGAFSRCHNLDGEYAPFCRPSHNTTLMVGSTYFVTWDPDYYNQTADNTTYEVALRVDYLNQTTFKWLQLETYDRVSAAWGFWPFKVENKHMKGHHKVNNVTLTLVSNAKGSGEKNTSVALPAALGKPTLPPVEPTPAPSHRDLAIALPVALGGAALLVLGICLWNRKTRRIHLRDVMSRARRRSARGYTGRGLRSRWRKDNGIQLVAQHPEPPVPDYTDDDLPPPRAPRRDSESLDSLAGSPVDGSFSQQGVNGGRNAFRDEVERQRLQRQDDDRYI